MNEYIKKIFLLFGLNIICMIIGLTFFIKYESNLGWIFVILQIIFLILQFKTKDVDVDVSEGGKK